MTLKEWAKIYCCNPCLHNVGDDVVAFPYYTSKVEKEFWNLTDYGVRSVSGGTIWLYKKDRKEF